MQLDAVTQLSSRWHKEERESGAASPEAIQDVFAEKSRQIIGQITRKELEKYSPERQMQLAEAAAEIRQAYGAKARVVPAEHVISPNIGIFFEAPPVIMDGNTFLPVRPVSEAFGAAVIWDEEARSVTVSRESATVVFVLDSDTAYIDGEPVLLDAVPTLIAEQAFVPLRFIAETAGLQVQWNEATRTILISSP